jgi:hypothetical protein
MSGLSENLTCVISTLHRPSSFPIMLADFFNRLRGLLTRATKAQEPHHPAASDRRRVLTAPTSSGAG